MAEDQATLEAMEPPPEDDYMDLSHIHPEKRTDLEIRKSQLMKEPDWNYYRPMERQVCQGNQRQIETPSPPPPPPDSHGLEFFPNA